MPIFQLLDLELMLIYQNFCLWKSAIYHSIKLPFFEEVAKKYRVFFQTDTSKLTRSQNCKDKWNAKKCKKRKKKGHCKKKKVAKKCKKTCEKCPTIPCPGNTIHNGDGNCVCPGSTIDYGNGNCSCAGDTVIDGFGDCSCPGDTVNDGRGTCSCPENTMNDGDGNCFTTNGKEITLIWH